MSIEVFSPFTFNPDQITAASRLEKFIDEKESNIFILKGHAGTGKTTLIDALIKYLKDRKVPVVLLASTGRAAKIVGEKARFAAETVHKHIYILDVEKHDDENKIRRLTFRLRSNSHPYDTIYIVDESSMISDRNVEGTYITFGTGRLLTDLFMYAGTRKIIFSGDPCQLPPVNALFSPCLNPDYLAEYHRKKTEVSLLQTVIRHSPTSGIHFNTTSLRKNIESKAFPFLKVKISGYNDLNLIADEDTLTWEYVRQLRSGNVEDIIMITFTNAKAAEMNRRIRALLFPGKDRMVKGESLLVTQNNYLFDIANGEHLMVTGIERLKEERAGLTFINISAQVKGVFGNRLIQGKLIENLLYSKESVLTTEQEYLLYRDFMIRIKKKGINPKSPAFLSELLTDPYLNAVRAKFGYAVTCHKAQGGEWSDVFIIFEKCLFNPELGKETHYRWAYTAISRAVRRIHFLNNICLE
jgi:ATP-dependent exoDNAse (exonuclease V) alpha subunit